MAILKQRLLKQKDDSTFDTIRLETSSDLVIRDNGQSVEAGLTALESGKMNKSGGTFTGPVTTKNVTFPTEADIAIFEGTGSDTRQCLRLYGMKDSNGVASVRVYHNDNLAGPEEAYRVTVKGIATPTSEDHAANKKYVDDKFSSINVFTPTDTPPSYPSSIPANGGTLTWAGEEWLVIYKLRSVAFLVLNKRPTAAEKIPVTVVANEIGYIGSYLQYNCMIFAYQHNLFGCNYLLSFDGLPVFAPSYELITLAPYWNSTQPNSTRIYYDAGSTIYKNYFWLSTFVVESGAIEVGYIDGGGFYGTMDGTNGNTCYLRPCVAIKL